MDHGGSGALTQVEASELWNYAHLVARMRSPVSFAPNGTAMSADGKHRARSSFLQVTT